MFNVGHYSWCLVKYTRNEIQYTDILNTTTSLGKKIFVILRSDFTLFNFRGSISNPCCYTRLKNKCKHRG